MKFFILEGFDQKSGNRKYPESEFYLISGNWSELGISTWYWCPHENSNERNANDKKSFNKYNDYYLFQQKLQPVDF